MKEVSVFSKTQTTRVVRRLPYPPAIPPEIRATAQDHAPPANYLPSDDQTQDPHVRRAIGRAWGWQRRMEVREFGTVRDLAIAVELAEWHVRQQLRLAYIAPAMLKRLVYGRGEPAVTVLDPSDCAALPWAERAGEVFEAEA